MYVINHAICNKPAYLYAVKPLAGTTILRRHFRTLEGEELGEHARLFCRYCGMHIDSPADIEPGEPRLKEYNLNNPAHLEELFGHE